MQISGAGEGGRMAGREPSRPAKAVAHEPFRPDDRETARLVRTPPRQAEAAVRPGSRMTTSESRASDTTPAETRGKARQAEARRTEARSEARSRQERTADAAETAARRKDVIDRERAAKDKVTKDALVDGRVRKDVAAKSAATGAKPAAAAPDAAQAEAVRAAADDDETADSSPADEAEEEAADAPGPGLTPIPAALAASVPAAPATGAGPAAGAATADPGTAIEAATPADPRIAALLSEAAKAGGGKDQPPQGGPLPSPDGLAAPDPSALTPQVKGTEAATPAAAESRPAVSVQAPLSAVPITIGMRALAGSNRFEIRLDPYELGRIDVSLDIAREHGTVKAHLVVERPETLALLQRDASSLQQALAQAGLDPGTAGLSFSLRDGGGQNPQRDQAGRPQGADRTAAPAEEAQAVAPLRNLGQRLGLDLRI